MEDINASKNTNKNSLISQIFFHDIIKKIFLCLLFIAISRINIFGYDLLLLLPLLGFAYALGSPYFALAVLSTLIGSITISTDNFLVSASVIASFFMIINTFKFLKVKIVYAIYLTAFIVEVAFRYGELYFNKSITQVNIIPLLIGIHSFYLTTIFIKMSIEFHTKHPRLYKPDYIIFLTSLIGLMLFAIPKFDPNISLVFILVNLLTLIVHKTTGVGVGMTFSVILSILMLSYFDTSMMVFLYLVPACTISLIKNAPKAMMSIIMVASFLLTSEILNYQVIDNYQILNVAIPAGFFILIDNHLLSKLARRVPGHYEIFKYQEEDMIKVKEKMTSRMEKFAILFNKIGQEFEKSEQSKQMREIVYNIYSNNCINCHKAKSCFSNSNPIVALIPKGILKELTVEEVHYIETNCIKPAKYLSLIDDCRKQYLTEFKYNQEYIRLKLLITEQLKGISTMLNRCKEEIIEEARLFTSSLEERVKNLLESHQFDVLYLHIYLDNLNRYYIEASVAKIDDNILYQEVIPLIEKFLNIDFKVVHNYLTGYNSYYRFELESTKNYIIKYGVSQVGKEFEHCGDTYRMFNKLDETIIALSDGMGVGVSAEQESKFTIDILEKMIDSGISTTEAIEHVNLLLKIKNRYDTYSTLDIMTFNNRTGEAYFTKTGAYASYILRRNRLYKIENNSLPIGIVDKVDPNSKIISLEDGDMIIMASDGVESDKNIDIESTLIALDEKDPQIFSSELLRKFQKSETQDDITIIVAKVMAR